MSTNHAVCYQKSICIYAVILDYLYSYSIGVDSLVIILDKGSNLGSEFDTYRDPETGITLDYGPLQDSGGGRGWPDDNATNSFFDYLGVRRLSIAERMPLDEEKQKATDAFLTMQSRKAAACNGNFESEEIYLDFETGTKFKSDLAENEVWNIPWFGIQELKKLVDKYKEYITNGFDLPMPVPEDLIRSLDNTISANPQFRSDLFALRQGCQGMLDPINQPMLYILKFCFQKWWDPMVELDIEALEKNIMNKTIYETPRPIFLSSIREVFDKIESKLNNKTLFEVTVRKIVPKAGHIDVHIHQND